MRCDSKNVVGKQLSTKQIGMPAVLYGRQLYVIQPVSPSSKVACVEVLSGNRAPRGSAWGSSEALLISAVHRTSSDAPA